MRDRRQLGRENRAIADGLTGCDNDRSTSLTGSQHIPVNEAKRSTLLIAPRLPSEFIEPHIGDVTGVRDWVTRGLSWSSLCIRASTP